MANFQEFDRPTYYELKLPTREQELRMGISPLPTWDGLKPGIILASGSPRNGRLALESSFSLPLSQLSLTNASGLLDGLPEYSAIRDVLHHYRERRMSWGIGGDGGLSLEKSRLVLAAAAGYLQHNKFEGRLVIIGRDYNVATTDGIFLDKPGYTTSADTDPAFLIQKGLGSWVIEGTDNNPVGPVEQYAYLYRYGSGELFTANAVTVLEADTNSLTQASLSQLADMRQQLPDQVSCWSNLSFMRLQVRDMADVVESVFDAYSSSPIEGIGYLLYQIPGVVDLSRSPFRENLHVWRDGQGWAIFNDFLSLNKSVHEGDGNWNNFPVGRSVEENELVGLPTQSIGLILKGLQ